MSSVSIANTYAHRVACTIRYCGDFASEEELSSWFESGDSCMYIHPDPDNVEVFNFKYRAEIVGKRYGYNVKYIHIEFDTNKDQEYILEQILSPMEYNDSDGNYPIKGKIVIGEIVDDTIYISNTEEYS